MKYPNNLYLLRTNKGLHQTEVAEGVGLVQSEYSKMERGERRIGFHIDKMIKYFNVDSIKVYGDVVQVDRRPIQKPPKPDLEDLPIYGLPFPNGGEGVQIQQMLISHCVRPDYLVGSKDSYACFVLDNNMNERFRHGELLYINPNLLIEIDDYVVVQIKVNGKVAGLIRKVTEITERQYRLSTLNPMSTETFKNSEIEGIHKIIGTRTNF